jgi:hypothetical protein
MDNLKLIFPFSEMPANLSRLSLVACVPMVGHHCTTKRRRKSGTRRTLVRVLNAPIRYCGVTCYELERHKMSSPVSGFTALPGLQSCSPVSSRGLV